MEEATVVVEKSMDSFDFLLIVWQIVVLLFYILLGYFVIKIYKKLYRYLDMRMKEMEGKNKPKD